MSVCVVAGAGAGVGAGVGVATDPELPPLNAVRIKNIMTEAKAEKRKDSTWNTICSAPPSPVSPDPEVPGAVALAAPAVVSDVGSGADLRPAFFPVLEPLWR